MLLQRKQSIEDQMGQSIFYNLSILKLAVKPSREFEECLSNIMFLKSNTKAFIHITQFLFNILDPKEFKSSFYWPINEKKAENAYRASSIKFINNLIVKHSLRQEEVKLVNVVHPCGKKFMSLILDLVSLATIEVMKKKGFAQDKSFDMDAVTETCEDMKSLETKLVNNIKTEIEVVKSKISSVQELLVHKIYPPKSFPAKFTDFIKSWNERNKIKSMEIELRNERIETIDKKTADFQTRASQMLSPKNFEIFSPQTDDIERVVACFENVDSFAVNTFSPTKNNCLNLCWLIAQLETILPVIITFVSNYSPDPSDSSIEELKVLAKLNFEVEKIESRNNEFEKKWKEKIPALIGLLKKKWEERKRLEFENKTTEELADEAARDQADLDNLKLLSSPRYYFDTSKECLKNVVVDKNRLALMGDDDENNQSFANGAKLLNSTSKSKQQSIRHSIGMGPPKQQRSRRLDPMLLLEGAISNKLNLNATSRTGTIPKNTSLKFSSTLLSPHMRQPAFDCSVISTIAKGSPLIENSFYEKPTTLDAEPNYKTFNSHLAAGELGPALEWNDAEKVRIFQKSPKGKLAALVKAEEIFDFTPKLLVDNETLTASPCSDAEITVKEAGCEKTDSFSSLRIPNDENLFNVSDTILNSIDE